jgi:hypothetical protein
MFEDHNDLIEKPPNTLSLIGQLLNGKGRPMRMTFELKAPPSKCNRHTRIILNYFWTSME